MFSLYTLAPDMGDRGWLFPVIGLVVAAAVLVVLFVLPKSNDDNEDDE